MKTKLSQKRPDGSGHEWNSVLCGYDVFTSSDTVVDYLNAACCKTYLNKAGEIIACCKLEQVPVFLNKAEKLYIEANS